MQIKLLKVKLCDSASLQDSFLVFAKKTMCLSAFEAKKINLILYPDSYREWRFFKLQFYKY